MRDLFRPRWIALHVLVAALCAAFVSLGGWQLGRLGERRDEARLRDRRSALPVTDLAGAGSYRRVSVHGTYDPERDVVLHGRAYKGRPGHHLLTPLRTASGPAVIVDRGWVPFEFDPAATRPPQGPVQVTGLLLPSERAKGFGFSRPKRGAVSRVDLASIGSRLPYPVVHVYLHLAAQDPPQDGFPLPVPEAGADLGPHLSYAIQWFLFAVAAMTVYVVLLTRRQRAIRADRVRG